jgi:hypothetical protein
MASEKSIKQVLDLLTVAEPPQLQSMKLMARKRTASVKDIINMKNVVGIGISEKISDMKATGKLSLTFYVEKKIAPEKLQLDELIPAKLDVSITGNEDIVTDVVVIGKLRPEINYGNKPIQPGFSIGHVKVTAGTLGAIVTDGKDHYILSNSHVLARSGQATKGDSILYPAKQDGGKHPADLVALLHDFTAFVPGGDFVNFADCAIAKPTEERMADLISTIQDVGIPKGVIKPKRGMKVVKVGRTTGKTEGEIRDINFRFVLDYGKGVGNIGFTDQVLCTRYTDGGDSGSLVIDQKSGKAVGLHFAGANGGSVFNPIDKVLESLNMKLVTKEIAKANPTKKKADQ